MRRVGHLPLLGLADRFVASYDSASRLMDPRASGVEHNELWSYRIERGRLLPARYGTSSDVQLWSCTDLAVQFALSRLPRP
jgi:hypothetical protein